jgi:uncharacterized protein (TIGR02678 family)
MQSRTNKRYDSRSIGERQRQVQDEEFRTSLRALLMRPLLSPAHEDFAAVRRNAEGLREWFQRETGWTLEVEPGGARLYKRPGDVTSALRGLDGYDRRRYVLLCLACAVLERANPQITLRELGERLLILAADPALAAVGFSFTLAVAQERRELVAVCRTLLDLGVLTLVAGEDEAYIRGGGDQADALYDVQRRMLASMLAAARGPSTWRTEDAPATFDERLQSLVVEHIPDSEEGRRTDRRHRLSRRLLDDPVVYVATLDPETHAYFVNQRGAMAARLCAATGLAAEQRAEGLALVDETGVLSDIAMPAEGTDAHATLLVAEHLAGKLRSLSSNDTASWQVTQADVGVLEIVELLAVAKSRYGRYWRKSAREKGAELELAQHALGQLEKLHLIERIGDLIRPLSALARFAFGEAEIRDEAASPSASANIPVPELELT